MLTAGIFLLPNGTFFVELAVFLVLIWLITKYVLPPLNARDGAAAGAHPYRTGGRGRRARRRCGRRRRAQARARGGPPPGPRDRRECQPHGREVRSEAQARGQAEYERIVASADAEVALARQRAVEEAANRMGDIVMDTVERVIGREVDAESHRDLIDQAVAALTTADAEGRVASVNPSLTGYAAAVLGAVPAADRDRVAADVRAVDDLVAENGELYTALTDTAVPAARPARAGRRPADRPGVGPGPPGRRVRRGRGHPARGPGRAGLADHPCRPAGGRRRAARAGRWA